MNHVKKLSSAAIATTALAVGIVAPAFAEGSRDGTMSNWVNGSKSTNWKDVNKDSVKTSVTFYEGCTREFTATIRRNKPLAPDPKIASEHIDCTSYTDAVKAGDLSKATYHFDVSRLGQVCHSGSCQSYVTRGSYKIRW